MATNTEPPNRKLFWFVAIWFASVVAMFGTVWLLRQFFSSLMT